LCDGDGVRRHIHVYVDGERAGLDAPLEPASHVEVIAAISGG
jgi:molybdopterin synthase sulfur carrier subunit